MFKPGFKTIRDPLTRKLVDISDVIDIINHQEFQRLGKLRQLGYTNLIFRGANHTRFEHCIGVYSIAKQYCDTLDLDEEVTIAGLLHDLPHSAFSHSGEIAMRFYTKENHDDRLEHLNAMEETIDKNYDFSKVKTLFKRKDPQWQAIWSIMGADKQDYVNRDLANCGFPGVETSGFADYVRYDEKRGLCFDIKQREWVRGFLSNWWRAHEEIYFRKKGTIIQEQLVRAIYHALESGELTEDELLNTWDSYVETKLLGAKKQVIKEIPSPSELTRKIINERGGYSTVFSVKHKNRGKLERLAGKDIYIAELEEPEARKFDNSLEGRGIIYKEQELYNTLGYHALICPIPSIDRLKPKDVFLDLDDGSVTTLFSEFPAFKNNLAEQMHAHYAVRVAVPKSKRNDAYQHAKDIARVLDIN